MKAHIYFVNTNILNIAAKYRKILVFFSGRIFKKDLVGQQWVYFVFCKNSHYQRGTSIHIYLFVKKI